MAIRRWGCCVLSLCHIWILFVTYYLRTHLRLLGDTPRQLLVCLVHSHPGYSQLSIHRDIRALFTVPSVYHHKQYSPGVVCLVLPPSVRDVSIWELKVCVGEGGWYRTVWMCNKVRTGVSGGLKGK